MPDPRLKDAVAWISGGASGIGEGVARLFAAEGAAVAVVDQQEGAGRRVADQITASGGRALFIQCDVSNDEQVRKSVELTTGRWGSLQIIVNCAGITHVKPLHEHTEQDWDRLMGVNLKSIFLSTKHGIAYLRKNKRSYIVNIGSISCMVGQAVTPAYCASKGAVLPLTRCIALDYAVDGVRCNCVCPGITDTPMLRKHLSHAPDPEGALRERLKRVPIGIALTPHDIAKSVLYFSCEDSAGVTGTSLVIDGGYIATAEWHTDRTKFMEE